MKIEVWEDMDTRTMKFAGQIDSKVFQDLKLDRLDCAALEADPGKASEILKNLRMLFLRAEQQGLI